MKYLLAIALLLTLQIPTFAATAQVSNLTDEQAAELELMGERMKSQNTNEIPTAEKLTEYAQVGEQIAKAIGAAAKECGVAVNDFVQTPVGKLTTFIIVYKLIGRDLIHYICGVGFFFVVWLALSRICGKRGFKKEIIYDDKGKKSKVLFNNFDSKEERQDFEAWRIAYLLGMAIISALSLAIFWT